MFKILKVVSMLAMAASLSACAVINEKPLPPPAATTAPMTTLKAVGLAHPTTVWVPAFYTGGNDDLLFINGRRYRAPNGAGNVVGFIKTAAGYSVAVQNVPNPTYITNEIGVPVGRLQPGARLEVFSVTASGHTIRELGSIRLRPYDQVFQTKSAFYVQDVSGHIIEPAMGNQAQGVAKLYSYYGLNAEGRHVSGPSNVLYATPMPNGSWAERILTGDNSVTGIHFRTLEVKDGSVIKSITQNSYPFRGQPVFFHSVSAFVNEEPVVDSERTGLTMAAVHPYNPMSQGYVVTSWFGTCNPEYPAGRQLFESVDMGPYHAAYYGMRQALFGTPAMPKVSEQMTHFGPIYTGYSDLIAKPQKPYYTLKHHPIFPMLSGVISNLGMLTGAHSGNQSMVNAKLDVFTVITPNGAILINANGGQIGAGYAVNQKAQLSELDIQQFAAQYGLMP